MKIPVVGFDPSMSNWGIAFSYLDLETGYLDDPCLSIVSTEADKCKQARVNSSDLQRAEQLAVIALAEARKAKVVFVEVPVGSQSARAMASYGVCVGILGTIRAEGIPLIEVTPTEVKVALTGKKTATKNQMIDAALELYPDSNWPRYEQNGKGFTKGDIHSKAEHAADAIATIHAGVHTPMFRNLMRLFEEV
jgi:Holliday junction resolvasome RuvABC endonuclease subunit